MNMKFQQALQKRWNDNFPQFLTEIYAAMPELKKQALETESFENFNDNIVRPVIVDALESFMEHLTTDVFDEAVRGAI